MNKQQLIQQIKEKQSFLCVGLDTDLTKIPQCIIEEAKAKDGGYVIVIKLKEETASFDGEKTKQAKGHASCMTLPDPAQLRAFGVKVKAAKLQYTATAIRAEVNADGMLTKVQYTVPFSAGLMGKYFLMHLDAAVDGTYSETVTLTY